jgi:ABC-type dipeptide/oligopeptide/nickel transport system permease subunit
MRIAETVLAIPTLIAIALVVRIVGKGLQIVVLFIGLFSWPESARVVRAVVLALREQDFVLAARWAGLRARRAMGGTKWLDHHQAPALSRARAADGDGNIHNRRRAVDRGRPVLRGIGVTPPQPSWGNMLYDAQQLFILRQYPWYWVPPGMAIFTTVLAVNLVGDGLRDALDPHG